MCHQAFLYKAKLHKSLRAYSSFSADRYFMADTLSENSWCYRFLPISTFYFGGISSNVTVTSLFNRLRINGLRGFFDSVRWLLKTLMGATLFKSMLACKFYSYAIRRVDFPASFNVNCYRPSLKSNDHKDFFLKRYESHN